MKKAIVIGAGLGGLSAAITMQAKGINVTVYNHNPHAGGTTYPGEAARWRR